MPEYCVVCRRELGAPLGVGEEGLYIVTCPKCGKYRIAGLSILQNMTLTDRQRANISGWLYDNQVYTISPDKIDWLTKIKAPRFHERADKLLLAIEKDTEYAGQYVEKKSYWYSCAWCSNEHELQEMINYLEREQRIITGGGKCKIEPNGWAHLEKLNKVNADSQQCFVAMWFDEEMNEIYGTMAKVIQNAGYRPHRVDKREHNDKIDDEVIAQIRRSRFIVADFTGHRGGVYYEAGFAKGLGLEVIWTCRKDELDELHFDVRQYNCIDWEAGKSEDFMERLTNRIESVLGKGTYVIASS